MITNQAGALYPTSFMVTEITALSDNLNWYTKTLVLPYLAEPSRSFWRNTALPRLRAASFILCRVWIPPYVIIKSAIISGGWIELAKGWLSLKWYISIPGFTILILFTLLNFAWTHAITMKCFKKSHASPKLTGYEEVSDSPNELKKRMVEKKR